MEAKNSAIIPAADADRFAIDLEQVRALAEPATRVQVFDTVRQGADLLSERFYDAMFEDPASAAMLDHGVVNARLHASMRRWLVQLFDLSSTGTQLAEVQRRTGEVHARIGVPLPMVSRGSRVLKRTLFAMLQQGPLDRTGLLQAALYIDELLSLALDAMASTFAINSSRLARSEEAYRLFFLGRDMKAERERRRSELLEWADQILERHYWNATEASGDDGGGHSPFSMWLHHKAAMLFEGAAEVGLIHADIQRVERELLPRLSEARGNHSDARAVVVEIRRCIDRIKELLGAMFDRYLAVEDGRDGVTELLNRRYFPAIAKREIEMAQAQKTGFAVLMIDIDRFGTLAAEVGAEASNLVLAGVAHQVRDSLRAGDFVFRIGDDDFLVMLVECDAAAAQHIAEGLRSGIEAMRIDTGKRSPRSVTVSIGIAPFDGHPDYQRLLDRADQALRRAKSDGRNRCVLGS